MSIQTVLRQLLPPILLPLLRRLRRARPEWEYVSDRWVGQDPVGWNAESVAATQVARWPEFLRAVTGTAPLGVAYESRRLAEPDRSAHNVVMSYGHALALAARARGRLTILDWGGGAGQYHLLSRALLPDLDLEYFCRDVPSLCAAGRRLQPEITFFDDEDEALARSYDFVVASGSLQYSPDWRSVLGRLLRSAGAFLYLGRVPVVHRATSFVAVQRPARHGYATEYRGWIFNRAELLATMQEHGATLVREYLGEPGPHVRGAPETGEHRAFLFRSPAE